MSALMSDRFVAGHAPFSTYHLSTAELIVALLWLLTLAFDVSLETATRGTMMAALFGTGDVGGATRHYKEALACDPDHRDALNNLEVVLAYR
jgi:hypothetical protein